MHDAHTHTQYTLSYTLLVPCRVFPVQGIILSHLC